MTATYPSVQLLIDNQWVDAAAGFRREFRQLPMLGAIINDIMEGKMEGDSRSDDITGMLVICAKTVIDCLDA